MILIDIIVWKLLHVCLQARSSYLPNEVLWGYRFVNLLNFKPSAAEYKVDFSAFNAVYKVNLDPRSQKEKDEEKEEEGEGEEKEERNGYAPASVSCYVPTFLPNSEMAVSRSCVEIMHMVWSDFG